MRRCSLVAGLVSVLLAGCGGSPMQTPSETPPPSQEQRTYAPAPADQTEGAPERQAPQSMPAQQGGPAPAAESRAPGVSSMDEEARSDGSEAIAELRDLSARLEASLRRTSAPCTELETMRDRICNLADRICALSDEDPDARIAARCRDGRARCQRAERQVAAVCR